MSEYGLHEKEWPRLLTSITHAINSKPLPTRQNLTANEIFLGRSAEPDLFEKSNWPLLSREKNSFVQPETGYEKIAEQFMRQRDEIADRIYKFVELSRIKSNQNKRRHRVTCIQFSKGDWVLISKAGTPREKLSKTKKAWGGPMQVTKIVSNNVYVVRDLQNKEYTVHAARMWFYDGSDFVPEAQLKELYTGDWGELEVSHLSGIRIADDGFEIETHWLGFEEPTWETIDHLDQFIPDLVTQFLEKGTRESPESRLYKKALRMREPREDLPECPDRVARIQMEGNTEGWVPEEDEILRKCIAKFGVGRYAQIQRKAYLPYRSRQQLANRTKRLIGSQALETYIGIHCDANRVLQYNKERYGTDFKKNETGIRLPEAIRDSEWEANRRLFEISGTERQKIQIPYFRRSDHLKHVELKRSEGIEELTSEERELLREGSRVVEQRERDMNDFKTRFLHHLHDASAYLPDIKVGLGTHGKKYRLYKKESNSITILGVLVSFRGSKDWTDLEEVKEEDLMELPESGAIDMEITNRQVVIFRNGAETVIAERSNTNEFIVTSNLLGKEQIVVHIRPLNARPISGRILFRRYVPWWICNHDIKRSFFLEEVSYRVSRYSHSDWSSLQWSDMYDYLFLA